MSLRGSIVLSIVSLGILLVQPAISQEPMQVPETQQAKPSVKSVVIISPFAPNTEQAGRGQIVKGTVTFRAAVPGHIRAQSVSFQIEENIGSASARPFVVEWNSASKPDGSYVVKSVALDESGAQVWESSAKFTIANKSIPALSEDERAAAGWRTYSSDKYGFSIQYPATCQVNDETALMKPREAGSFWIVFTEKSGGKPQYAINVRHATLRAPSTPERYAKYNPYLLKWERTTVNGMGGFKTTSGSASSERTIHRILLVDGTSVWMLNLTDVTGGDPKITKGIFDRAVLSLNTNVALSHETKPVFPIAPAPVQTPEPATEQYESPAYEPAAPENNDVEPAPETSDPDASEPEQNSEYIAPATPSE